MGKKKSSQSAEIERLEKKARSAAKALAKAREEERDRRTLGSFRDMVTERTEAHNDLIDRQTGYDTNDKARLFAFGSFDGALDGSLVWARLDAVYAVEKNPNESFTMLKTMDGPLAVAQTPDEVFNEFTRVRFAGSAEQVRELQGELLRREDKVRAAKEKRDAKSAASTPGPDFQAASDRVMGVIDDDDNGFLLDEDSLEDFTLSVDGDDEDEAVR